MTPEFDRALAITVLERTLPLEYRERELLAAMLRCAEWTEGHWHVSFFGLEYKQLAGISALLACLNLKGRDFVEWLPFSEQFRINHEKLMPQPIQKETAS